MQIGITGKPCAGQNPLARGDIVWVQPDGLGQTHPAPNTALVLGCAIVVFHPGPPGAAQGGIFDTAHEGGVLHGDRMLVIIPIDHPGPDLIGAASSIMQQRVKRMQIMISFSADLAEPGFEILAGLGHATISIPSCPIIHPAARACAFSVESGRRTGLVLFICTKIFCPMVSVLNASMEPAGPLIDMWPMRCPVF